MEVKHTFGTGGFHDKETYDTQVACDRCYRVPSPRKPGPVAEEGVPAEMPGCVSVPGWSDSDGKTCADYAADPQLCAKEENVVAHQICGICGKCAGGAFEAPMEPVMPTSPAFGCQPWEGVDTDHDGLATYQEVADYLEQSGCVGYRPFGCPVVECITAKWDIAPGGSLDKTEFCAAIYDGSVEHCVAMHHEAGSAGGCGPFGDIDTDKDGRATFEEVEASIRRDDGGDSAADTEGFVKCVFEKQDIDADGTISEDEFCSQLEHMRGQVESCMKSHGVEMEGGGKNDGCTIKHIDLDGDGSATLAEVEEHLKTFTGDPSVLQCVMMGWDVNKDGKITEEEYCSQYGKIVPRCMTEHAPHVQPSGSGGPMQSFWANFGLSNEAHADGCDTGTPGACCFVPTELQQASELCMAAMGLHARPFAPEEDVASMCGNAQCTAIFQLLDEIAAREGELCVKLEPVLHSFSALGRATCAPDDVNDGAPCITNAFSVAQEFIEGMMQAAFEELPAGPSAHDELLVPGKHVPPPEEEKPPEEEFSEEEEEEEEKHVLLGAFRDLFGLRKGPSQVVHALLTRMPGRSRHKVCCRH
jgi:hypothetical protein